MSWFYDFIYFHGYVCFLICFSILLIYLGVKLRKKLIKQFFFCFSAVFIALAIYELYFSFKRDVSAGYSYQGTPTSSQLFHGNDELLGYGPEKKDFVVRSEKSKNDTVLYDVTYTVKNGLRYTPNTNLSSRKYAIFLGCSFTFGEGVNDNETLPYFFNKYADSSYHILNYGYPGYGPHQALAITENKLLHDTAIINSTNSVVIYSFINDHYRRAAGYSSWDKDGPLYEIVSDSLVYKGKFSDKNKWIENNYILKRINIIWGNSYLYKKIFAFYNKKTTEYDIKRTFAIVKKMKTLLQSKGIRFICISDNYDPPPSFETFLKSNNIEYYNIGRVLEDKDIKGNKYSIYGDGHPTKNYYEKLGSLIANRLK